MRNCMREFAEFFSRAEHRSFRFLTILDVLDNADDLRRPPGILGDYGSCYTNPDALAIFADVAFFHDEVLDASGQQLGVKLSISCEIVPVRDLKEIFTVKFVGRI